jgi:hypothetical protein
MVTSVLTNGIADPLSGNKARLAGFLWVAGLAVAIAGESFLRGMPAQTAGYVAVALYVAMTFLIYQLFRPVNRRISRLAAFFNLVGLAFEALRWNPGGIDIALPLTGCFCLTLAWLVFKSGLVPRIFAPLVALSGLAWMTFLSPQFADHLSPYNLAAGILGEGSLMLWLLVKGAGPER